VENEPLKAVGSGMGNIVSTILGVVVIGLVGFGGYIYQTKDIVPKGELNKLIETSKTIQEQDTSNNELRELRQQLQEAKVQISKLNQVLEEDQGSNQNVNISSVTPNELDQGTQTREKVIKKIVQIGEMIDKTNSNTYTCKSFESGGIVIPGRCEKELFDFLQTNQDAKLFEIIGLVDDTEFRLIKNLEEVYGTQKIKDIKKYVQRGLSRQRVIEMTWLIKEYFHQKGDHDFKLNAVNYTLYSKHKRGFVLKAYY
jgi:5-bromo-4-chloroindolyl phosphate hydrolysis protein